MQPMLNIATRAAQKAGDEIMRYYDQSSQMKVTEKSRNDFVTQVDKLAEQIIIDTIHKTYPNHAFIAEESGNTGDNEYEWIIDPIDGTTNFIHGFPHFCVSIALVHNKQLQQAVVYDPFKQELFTASNGAGAKLNNKKIRVSDRKDLNGALLGTGFPFRDDQEIETFLEQFRKINPLTAGIRRAGSAALDMAYVACGRLDGFWEHNLHPWDIAAGILLVQEAGGHVTTIKNQTNVLETGDVLCANPKLHQALIKILA